MKLFQAFFVTLLTLTIVSCTSVSSKWHTEGPPNQTVQVKELELIGTNRSFKNANIGVANPVVVSFSSIGPSERRKAPMLTPPSIRIEGTQLSYISPEVNQAVEKALSHNGDFSRINNELWLGITSKYPSMTHLALTLFNVFEEWKLSGDASRLPYIWSSSIVARTIIVDLNTKIAVAEWRQEVADSATWTDAVPPPEGLARYLVPITTTMAQ